MYATRRNGTIILSDDGYVLSDLRTSGLDLDTPKRRMVLDTVLEGMGVRSERNQLLVEASPSNVGQRLHSLVQAMLAVKETLIKFSPLHSSIGYSRASMKQQRTLAMANDFERYTKKTRRALFLEQMEQVVPWQKLGALIEPFYPQAGNGRPPVGVERMLRMYFLQQWFNLSDPAVEDAVYESAVMRAFVGIDLGQEPVPDETTVCKFRHLLEAHNLGGAMLEAVNLHLESRGLRISTGTIVDATIIAAPSSTKNQTRERDPEMKQTKKGGQWYFGMKAHVGVDSQSKMIHSAVVTAANQADAKVLPHLLHGEETEVWGDQGYVGQTAVIAEVAPQARDSINRRCRYHGKLNVEEFLRNREKSKIRSKVEHVFQVLKVKFGFVKVRYRSIRKNGNRVFALCALVNLYIARQRLLRTALA